MIDGLVDDAAAEPAGNALVLQHRRRRAGLSGREISGQTFARLPARTRIFEPLGMKDTGFYVPKEKVSRLAQVHSGRRTGTLAALEERGDRERRAARPVGRRRSVLDGDDYARFCEMLLQGGQFDGRRLLAPRTVEMMRTNHVNPGPAEDDAAGTGWGMDFQVVIDAAAAGDPSPTGTFSWCGIAGTWFWIDPVNDLAFVGMVQHQDTRVTRPIHGAVAEPGVSGGRGLSPAVSEGRMR